MSLNGLLRFWGMGNSLEIEVQKYPLEDGDVIIIASDGVIKGLNLYEIISCVQNTYLRSSEHAARELCQLAEQGGSQDDITAIVIEVEDFEDEG